MITELLHVYCLEECSKVEYSRILDSKNNDSRKYCFLPFYLLIMFSERSSRNNFSQLSDKMVYLSNLPYEMTWMELKDIIREKAGEVCLLSMFSPICFKSICVTFI